MSYKVISQFNPAREEAFIFGDPETYGGVEVAGTVALFDALAAKGLSPTVVGEPLLYVIDQLPDENERALGVTLMLATEANDQYAAGQTFLAESKRDVGYCFSWTFTQEGDDITEIFVAIDADRLTPMSAKTREEDMGSILSLNEYLTTQLVLIGQGSQPGDAEQAIVYSAQELSAAEEIAGDLMREAIEKTGAPLIAIAPVEAKE
jgi:hypothetical protein